MILRLTQARPSEFVVRLRLESAAGLFTYSTVAFLFFGLRVVLRHGDSYVGTGVDPEIFIWSFAWWPHALLHGENPFVTHAIWAPTGLNLAWTTSVPGLALLFMPLTLLVGPLAAFDVAAVALPALAAWTCFLLCRHLTGSFRASLVGGYLFGFSSYMLGQQEGHMHMTSVFLIPLIALSLVLYLQGRLGARQMAIRIGVLLALQMFFSTELFFTLALAIGISLLVAYAACPAVRVRIVQLLAPLTGAYLLALVLASPLVYFALSGFSSSSINAPRSFAADLLNVVVPTRLTLFSWHGAAHVSAHFLGNNSERGAYLGWPILVAVAIYAVRRRSAPQKKVLLLWLAVAFIAELGAGLYVGGHRLMPLPVALVDHLPLFDNVLPVRISLFTSLITAVIFAFVIASSRSQWTRIVLPLLAVAAILPRPGSHAWITTPDNPRFITSGTYRACLAKNESTVMLPFGHDGDSMLWQAETGFWFRLAGGYLSPVIPRPFVNFRVVHPRLARYARAADVAKLAARTGARIVIVDARKPEPWRSILGRPARVGGVLIYRVSASPLPAGCAAAKRSY